MGDQVLSVQRGDIQSLLLGLKTTIEVLLASHNISVWGMYGGLDRLCVAVENILNHKLKFTQADFEDCLDYWPFIKGLKWLLPTSAPNIDRVSRQSQPTNSSTFKTGLSKGQIWLRESIQEHKLSSQLQILVTSEQHLWQYYYDDAFLCQKDYFRAMILCLQAVEQNKVALLTEIDLNLITRQRKILHKRSTSLPMHQRLSNSPHNPKSMISSPRLGSPVATIGEHGKEDSYQDLDSLGSSPDDSRQRTKETLLSVLEKSVESSSSSRATSFPTPRSAVDFYESDPLLNVEFLSTSDYSSIKSHTDRTIGYKSDISDKGGSIRNRASWKRNIVENRTIDADEDGTEEILNSILQRQDSIGYSKDSAYNSMVEVKSSKSDLSTDKNYHTKEQKSKLLDENNSGQVLAASKKIFLKQQSTPVASPTHRRVKSDFTISTRGRQEFIRRSQTTSQRHSMTDEKLARNITDGHLREQESSTLSISRESGINNDVSLRRPDSLLPQPEEGQSLMSYLSSQDFHTCANMDKENAHFSISEVLIAAIEQMKWHHVIAPCESSRSDNDSDEVMRLAGPPRMKPRQRKDKGKGKMRKKLSRPLILSDGQTDSTSSSQSTASPYSSTRGSALYSDTSDSEDEVEVYRIEISMTGSPSEKTNLAMLKGSGLSLSMASLYSDADIQRKPDKFPPVIPVERQSSMVTSIMMTTNTGVMSNNGLSADSVAISLLKRYSEKHLPKASDLEWLVSEQDAPQALLPLPDSYPISPDDGENADLFKSGRRPRIRGNLEWAPPRRQVIFNIHIPDKRNVLLAKQNDRCAGCGMKVEPGFMKRFRYCEYLGKYFCQCCHTNSLSYIPARIVRKWDFTKYYVSNFSRDLLSKMLDDPLFSIDFINPGLYKKSRSMETTQQLRLQLFHLKQFLKICKAASSLYLTIDRLPPHLTEDVHMYSLADLLKSKSGELIDHLRSLVSSSIHHIKECPMCCSMGFICELCNFAADIIFPFELHKVFQCPNCRACYHKHCYVPDMCPKCRRIEARRLRLLSATPTIEGQDVMGGANDKPGPSTQPDTG